ncbi:MAG: hypothetical protein ACRC8M_03910 [Cetobacterium sp.]|uniref:hypothetical protein n=1 Tax=Cetobacterium sp. TaxID=2071632 RepID=UPI003F39F272
MLVDNTENKQVILKDNIEEAIVIGNSKENKQNEIIELFYKLSVEEQENIKKCGQETKIQKMVFKTGKNSLISDYLIEKDYFNRQKVDLVEKNKSR